MIPGASDGLWPELRLDGWRDTYATLHRWLQIVGKTSLALAPVENHYWHCALHVSARGFRTLPLYHDTRALEIEFDFIDSKLKVHCSDGRTGSMPLVARSVADFYGDYLALAKSLRFEHHIYPHPVEMSDTLRFDQDTIHASYDADAARRCWQIVQRTDRLLRDFRGDFFGKCSPSHLWWGAFDLACTRFSGRRAPVHPGGVPNLPDRVTRTSYSHECISAGWWPGSAGAPVEEPAFYAYAYPEPAGCPTAVIGPSDAAYHLGLHEWILPYEAVRRAPNPDALVREFLQTTYDAAAGLANWDPDLSTRKQAGR